MSATLEKPQHLEALDLANRVRLYRFERRVTIGNANGDARAMLAHAIRNPVYETETMEIEKVLCWLPGMGPHRARRILNRHLISWHRPLGLLTERQRDELAKEIEG